MSEMITPFWIEGDSSVALVSPLHPMFIFMSKIWTNKGTTTI
ncbi:MAG: hypothetical protein PVF58_00045 [Candidatus Methanofastidiosia archaeon]